MNIYFIHASQYPDYRDTLYRIIRASTLNNKHAIFLPHETSDVAINSKDRIKQADLIIAEVSYPSTGLGIELGWAEEYKKPILCVHRADVKPSSSLSIISNDFIAYSCSENLMLDIEHRVALQQ